MSNLLQRQSWLQPQHTYCLQLTSVSQTVELQNVRERKVSIRIARILSNGHVGGVLNKLKV